MIADVASPGKCFDSVLPVLAVFPSQRDAARLHAAANHLLAETCSSGTRLACLVIVRCSGLKSRYGRWDGLLMWLTVRELFCWCVTFVLHGQLDDQSVLLYSHTLPCPGPLASSWVCFLVWK